MNRNSAAKYIQGCIHVYRVSSTGACHTTFFQTTLRHSPLRGRNLDVHHHFSHELSIRSVTMSDIGAEDVVEAVATSEANTAPTRAVAVSLTFSEGHTPEKVEEVAVQQHRRKRRHIERNRGARQ
jgi:hypothetical protein